MVWYGNSLFDITEKYIVIAARCHAATKENAEIYCIIKKYIR